MLKKNMKLRMKTIEKNINPKNLSEIAYDPL